MVKQGSYNVNENFSKDSSFKSFIFALLVFLALCIAIYLILVLTKNSGKQEDLKGSEKSKNNTVQGANNALVGAKEGEDSTTYHWLITTADTSKEVTQRDPSTKLPSTEQSIYYDTSSTDDLMDGGKDVEKFTDISQSTPNSVGTKEGFSNDYQSSTDMTTENDNLKPKGNGPSTSEMFTLTTETYKPRSEVIETSSARGTTYNFLSTPDFISTEDSEDISTDENFFSTTMTQINEVDVIRPFTDNFKSSTDSNLSESPTVSVSNAVDFDSTTNSAMTVTSSSSESVTLESSLPLSTTGVTKENKRTTFTNTFQPSTESDQSESPIILVSDTTNVYLTTNYTTPVTSNRKESITIENSTPLSTTEVTNEDKGTTRVFTDSFQSSTEINGLTEISVSDTVNIDSTTNSAETVTSSVIKESSVPLSTTQSYIHTTGIIDVTSVKDIPLKVCHTALCNRTTSEMLYLMNHAADPCEDFYEFACGEHPSDNFLKKLNFEAVLNYLTETDRMHLHNFQFLYESCVNYERDFKLAERIELMDYVPNNNLTELFVELILTQSMPLFDIGLNIVKDTSRYALQITLPGRSSLRASVGGWSVMEQIRKACLNEQSHLIRKSQINLNDIYTSFKECQKNRFKNSTKSFVENMQWYIRNPNNNSIYNYDNYKKLLDLLDNIQNLLPSELEIEEPRIKNDYNKLFKIEDLYKKYNKVDWKIILESLTFDGMFVENDIEVYFPDYIEEILNILNRYPERELMEILALYSKFQLYENTVIPKDKENRELYCMDLSNQIMPDVVAIIVYEMAKIDHKVYKHNKSTKNLFEMLKNQFNESLEKLESPFKDILQKTLNQIELKYITTVDYNSLIDNYKEITISSNNFQKTVISLLRNYRKIVYSLKGKEASAESLLTYFLDPFYTRPKTFYNSKYIVFHPAIFQRTSTDLPYYIVLSKIGLHLSQELAKHFDPIEIRDLQIFDKYNNLMNQTNDLLVYFLNNKYNFEGKSLHIQIDNSILWITKMIVDNTAFRLVVDIFNLRKNKFLDIDLPWIYNSYLVEKAFFIAAAQEYCETTTALNLVEDIYQTGRLPPPLRIRNMMSNSKTFSETFECPGGSDMILSDTQIMQFPYTYPANDYNYEYTLSTN